MIGVPDAKWGEVGRAVVVPKDGTAPTAEDLAARLDGRLARYKLPASFVFVDELPRSGAGKLQKPVLRETYGGPCRVPRRRGDALMPTTVRQPRELLDLVGSELGVSDWLDVDQARIERFADATGDHQWIHIDPQRAAAGPFGGTIAHGYLTLSLLVPMIEQILVITEKDSSINYGLDKVRFPAAVPVDSRLRMRATLAEASEIPGGVQIALDCVIEIDGNDRPACVARAIHRHLAEEPGQ